MGVEFESPPKTHPKTYLRSKARHVKEVEVSQVGQTNQCVFAVVFLSCGAEHNHGHLPHPTPFVRCELEFSLGVDFGKREHLRGECSPLKKVSLPRLLLLLSSRQVLLTFNCSSEAMRTE